MKSRLSHVAHAREGRAGEVAPPTLLLAPRRGLHNAHTQPATPVPFMFCKGAASLPVISYVSPGGKGASSTERIRSLNAGTSWVLWAEGRAGQGAAGDRKAEGISAAANVRLRPKSGIQL